MYRLTGQDRAWAMPLVQFWGSGQFHSGALCGGPDLVCGIFTGWSLEARPGYCGLALGHRCVLKELTETVYLDSRCDRGAPSLQMKGTDVGTRCKVTLDPEQAGP